MGKKDTDAFLKTLFKREAGANTKVINYAGYVGKYQFGESALIDLGYYMADGSNKNDWKGKWTGKHGIDSLEEFLDSEAAQDSAAKEWIALLCERMKKFKLDKFIGSTINGVLITESGIIAGAHLKGFGSAKYPGVIQFLRSNGKQDPEDGLGTKVSHYVELLGGYELGCCGHMNVVFAEKDTRAPIAGLKVQIKRNGARHKITSTDSNGLISAIRGFSIGDQYEIWVARLTGGWKQLRSGIIQDSVHNLACLSPKSKACATTAVHKGQPGQRPTGKQPPTTANAAKSIPAPQRPSTTPASKLTPSAPVEPEAVRGTAPAALSSLEAHEIAPIEVKPEQIDQLDINSALWESLPHIDFSNGEDASPGPSTSAGMATQQPALRPAVFPTEQAVDSTPSSTPPAPHQASAISTEQSPSPTLLPVDAGSVTSVETAAVPTVPDLPSAAKPVDAPVVEVKTIRSNSGHPKAIATKKALAPTAPVKEAGGKVIAGLLFPLEERPQVSYKSGGRNFGANRAGGRKHAGIDLYAPVGTPVRAMADGKVLQVYQFYLGTWVIEVDHGSFIARYGEVKQTNIRVKVNEEVTRGQVLGQVGKLQGLKASMLHLEMYSSTKSPKDEALTLRDVKPYQRRSDLMDPTASIDKAVME